MKNNQNISEYSINSDRQIAEHKRNNSIQTDVNEILIENDAAIIDFK